MTQYVINIGAVPNDGQGDPLRTAFNEVNLNFDQVWATGLVGSNIAVANNTIRTTNTNGNLVLNPNGIGVVVANAHVIPDQTRIRNLGSPTRYWDSAYIYYGNFPSANIGNASTITIDVGNLHVSGGTNGYYLQTDGTGNLTWSAAGGSGNGVPGGANTQVQFNTGNGFGGAPGFTFDSGSNVLSIPGDVNLPLFAKLNSGGIGNTNAAEFGTEVYSNGTAIYSSQIYMGAGTTEIRGIVDAAGAGLMYAGVEGAGFAGIVGMDPGVTSQYAIAVGTGNTILLGATTGNGVLTTTEYTAGVGALNANGTINGLLASSSNVVISNGNTAGWSFGADGSLQVPSNALTPAPGTIAAANGYPTLLAFGSGGGFGIHGGPELDWMNADDPANTFGDVNTLRNTMYLNGNGLYIGINENEVVGNASPSWLFTPNGNLTLPSGGYIGAADVKGQGTMITGGLGNLTSVTSYYADAPGIYSTCLTANPDGTLNITTYGNGTGQLGQWTFTAANLTLPNGATLKDTSGDSVAFGQNAGNTSQQRNAVAIGSSAGSQYQGEDSIAIGYQAGYQNQSRGVAIGYQSGYGGTLYRSVSDAQGGSGPVTTYVSGDGNPRLYVASTTNIDTNQRVFGNNIQTGTYVTAVYPGEDRVDINQIPTTTLTAGDTLTFVSNTIGIDDASNVVYPMRVTGTNIPANTFVQSAGCSVVTLNQYPTAPLTDGASLQFTIGQGPYSTAVGYQAGYSFQADGAVAVGYSAGRQNQSIRTVAVGEFAGYSNQSANAVAVGASAGEFTQGVNAVAVGYKAGYQTQGNAAVAIGEDAGYDTQGVNAVAIGYTAGRYYQGEYSIAIGFKAGFNSQANNSIILNATGSDVNAVTANTFVVSPVRASTLNDYSQDTGNVLYYNTATHEVTTAPANNITGDPFAAYAGSTGNVTVWTASSDQIVGAKLTVRVVYYNGGWVNTEMLDITAAKTYPDGTPVFTVSNRIKTNPAYTSVLIDVTLATGNVMQVISSAPSGAGNNVYWTCSATSFNQTFD